MRKAGAVLLALVIGYALAGGLLALIVLTPFGEFMHRWFGQFWGEPYLVRDTFYGREVNVELIGGILIMGGIFSASAYGAVKPSSKR